MNDKFVVYKVHVYLLIVKLFLNCLARGHMSQTILFLLTTLRTYESDVRLCSTDDPCVDAKDPPHNPLLAPLLVAHHEKNKVNCTVHPCQSPSSSTGPV